MNVYEQIFFSEKYIPVWQYMGNTSALQMTQLAEKE